MHPIRTSHRLLALAAAAALTACRTDQTDVPRKD